MSSINVLYPQENSIIYGDILHFRYDILSNSKSIYLKYVVLDLDGVETKIEWQDKKASLQLNSNEEHVLSGYLEDTSGKKIKDTDFTIKFLSINEKYKPKSDISGLIASKLPKFIQEDYKLFSSFVKAYYEWLNKSNNPLYPVYSSEEYSDIDKTPEIFLSSFRTNFLNDFPATILESKDRINLKNIIKNIKQYYSAKGSEKAYKFLFRLLYNTYVMIDYPRKSLLRASGNLWVENKFLKVRGIDTVTSEQIKNSIVYQYSKTEPNKVIASARIIDVIVKQIENTTIHELKIENIIGKFGVNTGIENLNNFYTDSIDGEEAYIDILTPTKIKQKVYLVDNIVDIKVTSTGLFPGDQLIVKPINNSTGNSFLALVAEVDSSGIPQQIRIVNSGFDYRGNTNNFEIYVSRGDLLEKITGYIVIDKVFFEPGYHEITVSEPSGANVLQDNRKYQELSYVLKTGIQEEEFLDTIKRLIHPAGFAVFTEPYIEGVSALTISPKIEKGNIYYKPLIGNFIAYQINSSVNLRNTGVVNKYDLFPNGYNPVEEKPNQTTPNTYFKHEVGTDGGISDGVELIRFGFLPALPDIDKRNDYWVVYPNLSHLLGSFKKIKDLKIKEVLRILAQRITF